MPFLAARVGGGASRSCRRPLRYHSDRRRRRGESFLQGVYLRATCCLRAPCGARASQWPPCSVLGISRHLRPQFSTSNCQRHFTTSKTLGAALAPIASRRRAHRRRQTPPTGAAMKLFAYEHPSGPVHEVEVTLGDTAHWRRLRRSNATTRSRRRRVDAFVAAPSRARSQVLQLKSKIEQAMRTSVQESNFRQSDVVPVTASARWRGGSRRIFNSLRDVHAGPTPKSSKRKNSTSPSAARNWTTTRRRSRRSASRRTTRCAPSPSR